eukprot:658328-Prymnesium_polylepis.4
MVVPCRDHALHGNLHTVAGTSILDPNLFDELLLLWLLRPVMEVLLGLEMSGIIEMARPRPELLLVEPHIPALELLVLGLAALPWGAWASGGGASGSCGGDGGGGGNGRVAVCLAGAL